jgi:uncharacterized OB-fold protein
MPPTGSAERSRDIAELRQPQEAATLPVADLRDVDVVMRTDDGSPVLRGSRCTSCGQQAFPPRHRCTTCQHAMEQDVALPTQGTLYAFSTVHVSSSRPVPYTLGFVDLPGDLRVLARLLGSTAHLRVDDPVELAVEEVEEGDTWGFRRKG